MKAKYYVEIYGDINRKWFSSPARTKATALRRCRWMGRNPGAFPVRLRHRGRIIARWKDGKLVRPVRRGGR